MHKNWNGAITHSTEETIKLGESLSSKLEIGDIISIKGELASGKTTFMKGVLKGLGFMGDVTSPTFTLVNEYDSTPKIIHIDCYRESDLNRWIGLGIHEYFESNSIVFIEWAELIKPLLPKELIEINFSHISENKREITLS